MGLVAVATNLYETGQGMLLALLQEFNTLQWGALSV